MDLDSIDRALGRLGQPPQPLELNLSAAERDARLENALWFPDREIPVGELADWAVALSELGKEPTVSASIAAVEAALSLAPPNRSDIPFVKQILAELYIWRESPQGVNDLRRLGDLWWSLIRNPPATADTPLGHAAAMAWQVAGYDPEGWGNPPADPKRLQNWLAEAANNSSAVVDVFSLLQQAVQPECDNLLVSSVRKAVAIWRESKS